MEILIPNSAVRNLIREDKIHQIYSMMQTGNDKFGMQTLNQSLAALYRKRDITLETALGISSNTEELLDLVGRGRNPNPVTGVAAGATIGSNHNSRSADGEIVAGRGFWPGLCVSLKHNSRFASFAILAKGDYPAELDIPIPFALISNDVSKDELVVMPAYWFLHNMYALARNSWKYHDRDKRTDKTQLLEFDFLAPDTIGEHGASYVNN